MTDELVIVVVANKTDLAARREVQEDKAREYVARVLGPETPLYEVSAKEDDGLCLVVREQEEEERITLNLGNLAYIYYQVLSRRYSFIWPGSWLTRSNTACHRTKRDRRRYKSKNHRRLPVPAVDFSKDLKGESSCASKSQKRQRAPIINRNEYGAYAERVLCRWNSALQWPFCDNPYHTCYAASRNGSRNQP